MLGMFLSERSVCVVTADMLTAPEWAHHPETGTGTFRLIALDAILDESGIPEILATYEEAPTIWERGLRPIAKESESCQSQE
jgi:hypothetical protein